MEKDATNILVTENINLPIKKEVGFVSITDASSRSDAIAKLKEEAIKLGGNALILLRAGPAVGYPQFSTTIIYAHGVVVEV